MDEEIIIDVPLINELFNTLSDSCDFKIKHVHGNEEIGFCSLSKKIPCEHDYCPFIVWIGMYEHLKSTLYNE